MRRLAVIFIFALAIRLAFIWIWYQSGKGDHLSSDGTGYYALAENLSKGIGFQLEGIRTTRRPPLYPVFIASLLPWGSFPLNVYLAQALIGALSCLVLFEVGELLFGQRAGLIASAWMAIDYVSVRQTVSVMAETLFVFFLILSFYCLIRSEKERKNRWLIGAGILSGASLLTRDVQIFYYPFLMLWFLLWKESWKSRIYRVSAFVIPLLLVIGPWILRNSLIHKRPVLITTAAASTFYLANNPTASGGTTGGDWGVVSDSHPSGDVRWTTTEVVTPEWERYIVNQSLDFIRKNPGRFAKLTGKKILNMWRLYQADSPPLARWLTAITYLPVITLGLAGIFLKLKEWRKFFPIFTLIAYTFLLHAVLIAHMRYRYPVMPFFMVFAAWVAVNLWEKLRTKSRACHR